MDKYVVEKYILLVSDFVTGNLPVDKFKRYYFSIVGNEVYMLKYGMHDVTSELFCDLDAYCGDPTIADYDPTDPFCDIDEAELRKRATIALEKLKILQASL